MTNLSAIDVVVSRILQILLRAFSPDHHDGMVFFGPELLESRRLFSSFSTLATFSNDATPQAITVDSAGNLFGTSVKGGPADAGFIWELPHGSHNIKTLYYFTGNNDGDAPDSIAVDSQDNLYGTALNSGDDTPIWELPHGGSSLIELGGFNDAGNRPTGIAIDSSGNLFGSTWGGSENDPYSGTIWQMTPDQIASAAGASTVYSFGSDDNGAPQYAEGIAVDRNDNVFIVTSGFDGNDGDIVELLSAGSDIRTVYSFTGPADITLLNGGLAVDSSDNLYGSEANSIFELSAGTSVINNVYSFTPGDAAQGIALDSHGNIFGVQTNIQSNGGSIFELAAAAQSGSGGSGSGSSGSSSGTLSAAFGKVSLPSAALEGGNIIAKLPLVITDSSSAFKGAVTITLYANSETSLDGNQIQLLPPLTKSISLKAEGSKTISFSVKSLPDSLEDGTYYLLASLTGSSNNQSVAATSQTITVAAPGDSLVPVSGSLKFSKSGASGSVIITNQGNSSPGGGMSQVAIYSSPDGDFEDSLLTQFSASLNLAPNKSSTIHFRLTSDEQDQAAEDGYVIVDLTDPSGNDQTLGLADNGPTGGGGGGGGAGGDSLALVTTDLPAKAPLQDDITVDDTFVNHGPDTDDASVDYYISTSKGLGGAIDLGSADLGPLDHGQTGYGEADLETGNIIAIAGIKYYILWVDDNTNQVFASRQITFT
jgi:hypothetical protein